MVKFFTAKRILVIIVLLGALLRFHGVDWDQGYHLHPDERAIIMAVDKLEYPKSVEEFLTPTSLWNPQFFAYGSFPMYLLQLAGIAMSFINPLFGEYTLINIVGRVISAFFDLATIVLLFCIGKKLFRPAVGLFAAFLYAISVLPIQLSHFYAVDTILTFFITAALYVLLHFYDNPTVKKALLIGLLFGLALATKVSAVVLAASIVIALFADAVIEFLKKPAGYKHYLPLFVSGIKAFVTYGVIVGITTLLAFIIFEPYALIDNKTFWEQTIYQSLMTKDAFVFPYTLQYAGKVPYLYELQNIFLFGLGPVLAFFCFLGIGYTFMRAILHPKKEKLPQLLILLAFFISYFWVVGGFAIGFMRYMLPVYPLLCLFGALLLYELFRHLQRATNNSLPFLLLSFTFYIVLLIWPLSFIQIYSHNNTRVDATTWIDKNIPSGKAIAIEHWDDGLPLKGQEKYQIITLELYNPDTPEKWGIIRNQLNQTDYIILASNRLSTPLPKLTDCKNLPAIRCYPETALYYKKLFSGELGFTKVAEFTNYPTVPLTNIQINDQSADESFTVYDHPKVIIFQKTGPVSL